MFQGRDILFLFVYSVAADRVGGAGGAAEDTRRLAAAAEAFRGDGTVRAGFRQVVVAHVVHPLRAFRQTFPLVPFHQFNGAVVADADAPVRTDREEVGRGRTPRRHMKVLVLPRIDEAERHLRSEMPPTARALQHGLRNVGGLDDVFRRQQQFRMAESPPARQEAVEEHGVRPRQQGRSNYTRRAPRANNNNQNRKPGAPAPAASAPQAAAEKPQPQHRKPQRRRAPQPQQAAASNAVNAAAPAPVQRPRSPQRRSYKQHYYDASSPAVPMHICPLGGLGEVGKNITLYECQGDMILVDCGLVFPDSDMFGVDLVIPDFTYVLENKDRIKGLFITHGHEDHIGSLPYLLKKFNVPIYTARLTIGLIKNKLEEHGLASSAEFHEIRPRQKVRLGCFTVEPIHVNHSIPDSLAFAIDCPAGIVLHTGDFKIDYTPLSGDAVTDLSTIAEYGRRGVLALLADSTNAERPGFTATEQTVAEGVRSLFARAKNRRIIVATFASNIYRIQQIIDLAIEYGRKVAVNGRSMVSNTEMARELGYLHAPDNVLIDIEEINKYPPEKVVLITTGSQGEPLSALSRMAQASHRTVKVGPTDFIIISARPIPGNEKTVTKVVNGLLALGAEVIYENMYDTHVSGHACQEEQKLMLTLAHPQYFLPVHGEFKQLKRHAETAEHLGYIPKQNIYIAENGQNIRLSRDGMAVEGTVPAGAVMVDGYGVGDVGNVVLRDRHHLSEDGIIIVTAAVDGSTGQLLSGPDLVSRGFVYVRESEELMDGARVQVEMALDRSMADNMHDWASVKSRVREALSSYIYRKTKRSPMILPILMEV